MQVSLEEPTGLLVRSPEGEEVALTFKEFVQMIEEVAVLPDDLVWSRIVTGRRWRRAGDMRVFQMLARQASAMAEER